MSCLVFSPYYAISSHYFITKSFSYIYVIYGPDPIAPLIICPYCLLGKNSYTCFGILGCSTIGSKHYFGTNSCGIVVNTPLV
jgi:hypothetical protein